MNGKEGRETGRRWKKERKQKKRKARGGKGRGREKERKKKEILKIIERLRVVIMNQG